MFNQRAAHLRTAFLSAVAAQLLLTAAGQSAVLTGGVRTTAAANAPPTTQPHNSSAEGPAALALHRPCRSEDRSFCLNGAQCMYPQDSDKPFCICTHRYHGSRCHLYVEVCPDHLPSQPELEKVIAAVFAVVMLVVAVTVGACCCARKRCMTSAPLIKYSLSETSV